jgi:hypothetical protein
MRTVINLTGSRISNFLSFEPDIVSVQLDGKESFILSRARL